MFDGEMAKVGAGNEAPARCDYSRDALLTDFGRATLADRYLLPGEKSPQDAFLRAARAWADDEAHAQRLYDYVSRLWFMFATPVLSNAPRRLSFGPTFADNWGRERFDGKFRGMPISCFLNVAGDSREGLTDHYTENAWLSSVGGGIGGYWGGVRSNGAKTSSGSSSSGVIPFMKVVDSEVLAFSQGETRRGSYAAYLDISHPEIVEFIEMRKPTGGDVNRKCLNLHNAVNIPDAFMQIIERCMVDPNADDSWDLVDPHSKAVIKTVSAKELWQRLLDVRMQTGEPYLHFIDTTNRFLPEAQKALGLRVNQSNLCSEITLATSEERTAVCCLSSVNLEKRDEWKDHPLFIEDLVRMLDNVLEFFVRHAPAYLSRAVESARCERSIGLGAMGFHSYLQSKMIPFEGLAATLANRSTFREMRAKANAATRKLAAERGQCPDSTATNAGVRNMHLLSIAPNASSSIICGGASPSIEPNRANAFTHKTGSGSWLVKNPYLAQTLEQYGKNTDEVWSSIVTSKGSVQHLDFLTDDERSVFKTAMELNQMWLIEHAAHRQEFICQSQSLNVFLPADVRVGVLHQVHYQAWKKGVKTMYYLRSEAIKRADNVSQQATKHEMVLNSRATESVCLSCEG